ncbi:MAG: CRISPR-associated endonuclease Cas6 [Saprospiraceae bacterium]|nr:CRISPR-associated endonuclease Cas6 [Saprospiraceae bacterium]MCF8249254.1 CRISPR-associated endonuclease Cas6 [Saprospiraceae bacterium]MCF8281178.1 CRISPR-associated endonuclease Cas6 [Bacteroidales bacterium]MCF8311469.1 CRISPR-associated endonuclease Cas6 [Saprospiraceae bacterium]MCF8439873.1 CRISPR-associated endonuclease Cas6 [Saprospiraceae bacterium]
MKSKRCIAHDVGWELDKSFEVKITKMLNGEWVCFKDIKVLAFTVEFKVNLSIPDFIGLGQGSGEGFGVVRRQGRDDFNNK